MKNKIISTLLTLTLFVSIFIYTSPKASAQLAVAEIGGNLLTNIITTIEQTIGTIEATISAIADEGMWSSDMMDRYMLPVLKQASIEMMHGIVSDIVGSGNNGKPAFVTDWNDYLYVAPQQEATVYMNSFFNSVSAGRLSGLNYEGVGQDYDQYLKQQAQNAIFGNSSKPYQTTIRNYTSDPQEMFSGGNFKAFSAFLDCPNNPYCYSLTAENAYNNELQRLQTVAAKEVNSDGFLPKKVNGQVVTPGSQFQSAVEGIDQLAGGYIVNAENYEELISGVVSTLIRQATSSLVQGIAGS